MQKDWDWARIAVAVREQRQELDLSQEALATRAQIGSMTLRKIETGKHATQQSFRTDGLARLEKELGWAVGSIRDLGCGREARPIPVTPRAVDTGDPTGPMHALSASIARQAFDSVDWTAQVRAEVEASGRPDFPDTEIGQMLRKAWDTFTEANVPVEQLIELTAWWRMRTAAEEAFTPPQRRPVPTRSDHRKSA